MTTTPKPVEGKKKKKEGGNAGPDPATAEYIAGRISSDGREHKLADCQSVFVQLGEGGGVPVQGQGQRAQKQGRRSGGCALTAQGRVLNLTQPNPSKRTQVLPSRLPSALGNFRRVGRFELRKKNRKKKKNSKSMTTV